MAAKKGRKLRIKLGNAASPEVFAAIAGAREDSFTINNGEIDITDKDDETWKALLAGGVQNVSLSVSGVAKTKDLKQKAFNATLDNYEIENEDGDVIAGTFQIRSYEGGGDYEGNETFSCSLESSGAITFTPAA